MFNTLVRFTYVVWEAIDVCCVRRQTHMYTHTHVHTHTDAHTPYLSQDWPLAAISFASKVSRKSAVAYIASSLNSKRRATSSSNNRWNVDPVRVRLCVSVGVCVCVV